MRILRRPGRVGRGATQSWPEQAVTEPGALLTGQGRLPGGGEIGHGLTADSQVACVASHAAMLASNVASRPARPAARPAAAAAARCSAATTAARLVTGVLD